MKKLTECRPSCTIRVFTPVVSLVAAWLCFTPLLSHAATDLWQAKARGITARVGHSVVWTGTEMIAWGGGGEGAFFRSGGRYNLATDTWVATSLENAPTARWFQSAVWTGHKMIVWGGRSNFNSRDDVNTGALYDPATDTWHAMSTNGAPSPRSEAVAVWTGSEMLVWGGLADGSVVLADGYRYQPTTDTWSPMASNNAPSARFETTAIWTGTEMIVWGGARIGTPWISVGDGARYNPATDTWTPLSTADAPESRARHTSVWTGTEMIVWGGAILPSEHSLNTGGRYDPHTDTWLPLATNGAPQERFFHAAVWTGEEMLVWGGGNSFPYGAFNTGGRYNPDGDFWSAMTQTNAPVARQFWRPDAGIWTGEGMLLFGGSIYPHFTDSNDYYLPHETSGEPPIIVFQPQSQSVLAGTNAVFRVVATGTRPIDLPMAV